jgi:hypothetical protein
MSPVGVTWAEVLPYSYAQGSCPIPPGRSPSQFLQSLSTPLGLSPYADARVVDGLYSLVKRFSLHVGPPGSRSGGEAEESA